MATLANVVFDDSDSENDPDFVPDDYPGMRNLDHLLYQLPISECLIFSRGGSEE